MQYLWNTGGNSQKLVDAIRAETGIPIVLMDHPVPQDEATKEGLSPSYDEGAALLGGYISVACERRVTHGEREMLSHYWTGQRKLKSER